MADAGSPQVLHVCIGDAGGGAAKGAYRLHRAMVDAGVDSRMLVRNKRTADPRVIALPPTPRETILRLRGLNRRLREAIHTENPVFHSYNVEGVGALDHINRADVDIVQLHWVGDNLLGIGEIAQIRHPVVWKLPDMWAFSGAEHYQLPDDPERFAEGYLPHNRPVHESGKDVNRIIWRLKRRVWRNTDFAVVTPSRWLAECARRSRLFGRRRVRHIINPIDLALFRPGDRAAQRRSFGLPEGKRIILFGAHGGTVDRRKGFHHLLEALEVSRQRLDPARTILVAFGAGTRKVEQVAGFETHELGVIGDDATLVAAYGCADVFVLPAEMDNLPNVMVEASCCGVPGVGFDVGGMPDLVAHRRTGWLARPYDPLDLAEGIVWTLENADAAMRARVRAEAEVRHSPAIAVENYLAMYRDVLASREKAGKSG